jgi:flagellar protein FliJ
MTTRRWLGTVLRARQAQEDVAVQNLADARRSATLAARRLARESGRIAALPHVDSESVQAFHASTAARQAAAATLSAARHRLVFAQDRVTVGEGALTDAARARRTVEKMHERDIAVGIATEAAVSQRELDEIGISRYGAARKAAQ